MVERKTGILVHGYNLNADNWMDVAWGRPPDQLGRVPRAVLLAAEMGVDVMVFGTGASERDGVKEGEWTIRYLLDHFGQLSDFPLFWETNLASLEQEISQAAVPELTSRRTSEEAQAASSVFVELNAERVFVVSSPDHIFRCHLNMYAALTQLSKDRPVARELRRDLFAVASDVPYRKGRLVEEVVIDER